MIEKAISIERICAILGKLGVRCKRCENLQSDAVGFETTFGKETFPVKMIFSVNAFTAQAVAFTLTAPFEGERRDRALTFCTEWNRKSLAPRAYVDEQGDLCADMTLLVDESLTDAYLEENFVQFFWTLAKEYFKAAAERFPDALPKNETAQV